MSDEKPYAYVFCDGGFDGDGGSVSCGQVGLTEVEYSQQLSRPNRPWMCPKCGAGAQYDDTGSEALQLQRETGHLWNLEQAVELSRKVEPILAAFACHVALTGGTLYREGHRKDCDLIIYREGLDFGEERGSFFDTIDRDGLLAALGAAGLTIVKEHMRVVKMITVDNKRVDLIFPEIEGEYTPPNEKGTELLSNEDALVLEGYRS